MKRKNVVQHAKPAKTIEAELDASRKLLADKETELEALRAKIANVRGTRDLDKEAMEAVAEVTPLASRIEAHLRNNLASQRDLSVALGVAVGPISEAMKALKEQNRVYNVGTAEAPKWTWVGGPEQPWKEFEATVLRLLQERPISSSELATATGCQVHRVYSVIGDLQNDPKRILISMGRQANSRWFLVPPDSKVATKN